MNLKMMGAALVLTGGLWAASGAAVAAESKVAYLNLSEVFDNYEKTKKFDADLQKEAEAKRADREKLVDSVKKMRDELELLSPENRPAKQQEVDQKVQELQAFDNDTRLNLRRKRDTMIREILQEIDEVIQQYGREQGYDYVFNDRVLLFKKEQSDISDAVSKRLNEQKKS